MEMYYHWFDIYKNGKCIDSGRNQSILCKKPQQDIEFDLTWENLHEKYQSYGLLFPFNIWNFKKGRLVSFFNGTLFQKEKRDIKEWKGELGLHIIERYRLVENPSFEQLKHFSATEVQRYLKERE